MQGTILSPFCILIPLIFITTLWSRHYDPNCINCISLDNNLRPNIAARNSTHFLSHSFRGFGIWALWLRISHEAAVVRGCGPMWRPHWGWIHSTLMHSSVGGCSFLWVFELRPLASHWCWWEAAFSSLLWKLPQRGSLLHQGQQESAIKSEVAIFYQLVMEVTSWSFI